MQPSHDFCRAMLCTSVAYADMWCLPVRPFVTFVHSVERRVTMSSNFFHRRVAALF